MQAQSQSALLYRDKTKWKRRLTLASSSGQGWNRTTGTRIFGSFQNDRWKQRSNGRGIRASRAGEYL